MMTTNTKPLALIVGVGDGLSASLARLFHANNYHVMLAARNVDKLSDLAAQTEASVVQCDAAQPQQVQQLFADMLTPEQLRVVIYNPSLRVPGPIHEVDPVQVKTSLDVTAYGAFLVGQQAAATFLRHQRGGAFLVTGASAGTKGFAQSAAFAMGKFAQRGLVESMARELHPHNIHVCWINIDGAIRNPGRTEGSPDSMLDPDAIAQQYYNIVQQDRSVWTSDITLRPWVEKW